MVVPPTTTNGDTATATAAATAADNNTFTPRPWFGGAMSASLPSTFLDASDVRPVPDHQEVWHDSGSAGAGAAAVMVEIVEHDAKGVSDAQAGAHFFADAAEGAGADSSTSSTSSTFSREVDPLSLPAPRMPGDRPTAAREGAFVVGASGQAPRMLLAAAIAVFRVPSVASDIVIASFEPVAGDDGAAIAAATTSTTTTTPTTTTATIEAAAAGAVAVARQRLARVVETVQVNDWGLFGGGEGGGDD